jgi:hypothetical protein
MVLGAAKMLGRQVLATAARLNDAVQAERSASWVVAIY